ncbi:MAG: sulfatase [bacterium]|nr:sulfatase [bacterium]
MPQYTRRDFIKTAAFSAAALAAPGLLRAAEAPARRPNVLFILADDLGWSDTTINGTTRYYETPNIEKLARLGMRFTHAYAANPLCSPTRASIMTGLYPARIGIIQACCHVPTVKLEATLQKRGPAWAKSLMVDSVTRLKREYVTLAESFKGAGYRTGHFGKWHLGPEPYDPFHQGFDVDVPHTPAPGPGGGYLAPWKFLSTTQLQGQPGEHIEDRMAREAVGFMKECKAKGTPFYMSYWSFSVHAPLSAKQEPVDHFMAKADPASPQRNPVYAAMVKSLDDAVGTLLAALDEEGLADNTIIVFMSDNGGYATQVAETSPAGFHDIPVTSNTPLRGGKATIYEGGTREPCAIVWPGKVKPASVSDALLSSVDFHPTLLDMCGIKPRDGLKFDGVSQVPALLGRGAPRKVVFCHFPFPVPTLGTVPSTYVRKGDWKLIRFYCDNPDQTDRHELYNLKDDLGETKDLAAAMPDKVKELGLLIDRFLADTQAVVPEANPAYDPKAKPPAAGPRAATPEGAANGRHRARTPSA